MSVIRVNYLPRFDYGHDAVLLTLNGPGTEDFRAALNTAIQQSTARIELGGITHEFVINSGHAAIVLRPTCVVWQFDQEKAREIVFDLEILINKGRAGHTYVDISSPAPTLVISRDEYVESVYPWISPPASDEGAHK